MPSQVDIMSFLICIVLKRKDESRLGSRRRFYNLHFHEDLYCSSINSDEIYQVLAFLMYNVSLLLNNNNNRKTISNVFNYGITNL